MAPPARLDARDEAVPGRTSGDDGDKSVAWFASSSAVEGELDGPARSAMTLSATLMRRSRSADAAVGDVMRLLLLLPSRDPIMTLCFRCALRAAALSSCCWRRLAMECVGVSPVDEEVVRRLEPRVEGPAVPVDTLMLLVRPR